MEQPPEEIKAALPFKDAYDINTNFNASFPSPRVRVTNKAGALPNIEIIARPSDLLIQSDASKPNCDSVARRKVSGTLTDIRMEDVCKVSLQGYRAITTQEGFATFDNFTVVSGPQVRNGLATTK